MTQSRQESATVHRLPKVPGRIDGLVVLGPWRIAEPMGNLPRRWVRLRSTYWGEWIKGTFYGGSAHGGVRGPDVPDTNFRHGEATNG